MATSEVWWEGCMRVWRRCAFGSEQYAIQIQLIYQQFLLSKVYTRVSFELMFTVMQTNRY